MWNSCDEGGLSLSLGIYIVDVLLCNNLSAGVLITILCRYWFASAFIFPKNAFSSNTISYFYEEDNSPIIMLPTLFPT
jgi:hypothetical protein